MELGLEVLDQQVSDRNGLLMGKVDGILLQLRPGKPPRVAHLVIGGGTAVQRISPRLAEWLLRWRHRWGPKEQRPLEVPWSKVLKIGIDVQVDLDAKHTAAWAWESWVVRHIIGRIPGA